MGWAAKNGLIAAYGARSGATGPVTVFEGNRGLFHTHALPELCDISAVSAELGTRWETERVSIKPYPCCHFAHGAIDCATELHRDGLRPENVTKIHAIIDEVAAGFVCKPMELKHAPESAYGAKFSLPFLVASGLIDGDISPKSFTDDSIRRHDVLGLARKVSYENAQVGTTGFPRYFPGHLIVTTTAGTIIEKQVKINRGNPDAPMSDADVIAKFASNIAGVVSDKQAKSILDALFGLPAARDISKLIQALTGT